MPEEGKGRSAVGNVHSVIKRKSGSSVRSRTPEIVEKGIASKIIAYKQHKKNNNPRSFYTFIFIIFRFSTELLQPSLSN